MTKPLTVQDYIEQYSGKQRKHLDSMRSILSHALHGAEECISYAMPAFKMGTVLVYFAAQKQHLGFYPTSSGIRYVEQELGEWKYSKGAIQFPYDKPLPKELITRIARKRLQDVLEGKKKKQCLITSDSRKKKDYEKAIESMEDKLKHSGLAKPALRALINCNITTIKALKAYDKSTLEQAHGIGKRALEIIQVICATT